MSPVAEMLDLSDPEEVWATPLYDRAPMPLPPPRRRKRFTERPAKGNGSSAKGQKVGSSDAHGRSRVCEEGDDNVDTNGMLDCAGRITVLGDACHPMSMFKGQGANQVSSLRGSYDVQWDDVSHISCLRVIHVSLYVGLARWTFAGFMVGEGR